MSGTETYAPGGAIGGGSDNFTWYQNAFDQTTLAYDQAAGTGTQTDYVLTVYDTVQDTMSDVGSDVLGPSDSILSGGDSYSITDLRDMSSTVTDDGSSATPLYVWADGWDDSDMGDSGSSTLSASGQSYGLDTVAYNESSSDTSTDSEAFGNSASGSMVGGGACDYYTDSDASTITNSNGVTTSNSSFSMQDTHSVAGWDNASSSTATAGYSSTDSGWDDDISSANGTAGTAGNALTFADTDTSGDTGSSSQFVNGGWSATGSNSDSSMNYMGGTSVSDPTTDTYNYVTSTTQVTLESISGTTEFGGSSYPFWLVDSLNETLAYRITGLPASTATLTSLSVYSQTEVLGPEGGEDSPPMGGTAAKAPAIPARSVGSGPGGPVEGGGGGDGADISRGVVSGLGGEDAHGLDFTGPEVQPVASGGTIVIGDGDGLYSGHGAAVAWSSLPVQAGYVRGNQGSGSGGGEQAANMDSGTRDGTPADEAGRLGGSGGGSEENPTSALPAPTPRDQQQADDPDLDQDPDTQGDPGSVGNLGGADVDPVVGGGDVPAGAGNGPGANGGGGQIRAQGGPVTMGARKKPGDPTPMNGTPPNPRLGPVTAPGGTGGGNPGGGANEPDIPYPPGLNPNLDLIKPKPKPFPIGDPIAPEPGGPPDAVGSILPPLYPPPPEPSPLPAPPEESELLMDMMPPVLAGSGVIASAVRGMFSLFKLALRSKKEPKSGPEKGPAPTGKETSQTGPKATEVAPNGGLGPLKKVNKPDAAADALAQRLGGESRVKFANGPDNEFDAVSDLYVAQTKPANFKLGSAFRDQAKTTFETAQKTGRTPYFHFDGPPQPDVLRKLAEYAKRYGIEPIIDTTPL